MTKFDDHIHLGRRAFLKKGTLVLAAASLSSGELFADDEAPRLRVGLVTDLHYADKAPAGTRHYRETLAKLDEAAAQFEKDQPTFLVELGDLIDAADSVEVEQKYLKTINREFSAICKDRHYVLGNHCVDTLKKDEFLGGVEQEKSYYSFDRGGFHFVVLDSCFRSDGEPYGRKNFQWTDANIPAAELEWLKADSEGEQEAGDRLRSPTTGREQQPRRQEQRRRAEGSRSIRQGVGGVSGAQPPERSQGDRRHPLLHAGCNGGRLWHREQRLLTHGHRAQRPRLAAG